MPSYCTYMHRSYCQLYLLDISLPPYCTNMKNFNFRSIIIILFEISLDKKALLSNHQVGLSATTQPISSVLHRTSAALRNLPCVWKIATCSKNLVSLKICNSKTCSGPLRQGSASRPFTILVTSEKHSNIPLSLARSIALDSDAIGGETSLLGMDAGS